jgi:arylsulfatase A-like enzyme
MKSAVIGALVAAAVLGTPALADDLPATRPNIVFIFADDLGWRDVGFNGSRFYETPHIDRLASQGMVFTNAYANAANCVPSRACLLSGQYGPRHRVYAVMSLNRGIKSRDRLDVKGIRESSVLTPETVTFGEALRSVGYATACIGKWHVGKDEEHSPGSQGFDTVVDQVDYPPFRETNDPKNLYAFSQVACEFMEKNKERPFLLYLAHHAVHLPFEAREEKIRKYEAKKPVDGQKSCRYAAMVEHTDDSVGIVMDKLKELGLEGNTFVLFFSDNGGMPFTPQTPLRGHKGMYYEGGIREPMIVRWPGNVKPGTSNDTPVSSVDFYPTFLELAGAPRPEQVLDGESIVPLLRNEPVARKPVFWHFPGYLRGNWPGSRTEGYRTQPVSAIRKGDYKLLLFHEEWVLDGGRDKIDTNRCVELYNLKEDRGETANLAARNAAKRDELLDDLLAWIEETNAPIPSSANPGLGQKTEEARKKIMGKK